MKNMKRLIIILTILLMIPLTIFITRQSNAATPHGTNGVTDFTDFAHLGYSTVKNISFSEFYLSDGDWSDWGSCHQVMCIHHGNSGTTPQNLLVAIVDIDKDGNAKAYTKNNTSGFSLSSNNNQKKLNKFAAAFSYYAEKEVSDYNSFNTTKTPFVEFWNDSYRDYINSKLSLSLPLDNEPAEGWDPTNMDSYVFAETYMNANNPETKYEARLFIFGNGAEQNRIVLFGAECSEPDPPTINKYISSVTKPDGTSQSVSSRSGKNETWKNSNPVGVLQGSKVTYTIKLEGDPTDTKTYQIEDTYRKSRLKYESSSLASNKISLDTSNSTFNKLKFSMKVGDTVTVTLDAYDLANYETAYKNEAKIVKTGDYSRDYITYIKPTITLNKYIISVKKPNGTSQSVSNRSGKSESQKSSDPVKVVQGSEITYRIVFTCNSTQKFTIKDTYDSSNLQYISGDLTRTSNGCGTTSYDVKLRAYKFSNTSTKYKNTVSVTSSAANLTANDYIQYKKPTLTLNKYITKVEYPHITSTQTYSRSSKTEAQKELDPVKVVQGCEITYKIVFTCDSTQTYTITDTYDSNLVHISGQTSVTSNPCSTSNTQGKTEFTIKLRAATFTNTTTKYKNTATAAGLTARDYIQYREPQIRINKYVTKVTHPNGVEQTFTRSGWNNTQKYNTAVDVVEGTIVNYTITFECESTQYFTVTDTYNTDALKFVSGTTSMSMNHGKSFTITLEAYRYINTTTKYPNTVTVSGRSETASDYVIYKELDLDKKEISGTYKKYITKHNGTAVSPNRKNYDNSTANKNPLTVVQGDNVTYKLEVSNYLSSTLKSFVTVDYKITSLKIRDEYDNGLSYGSNQYFEHTFTNVNEGTTSTKSFTSNVTKSNMYLLPLENRFSPVNGKYNMTVTNTHTLNGETVIFTESYTNEDLDMTKFTSNANKDYVQLDDVEIAGNVWLDNDNDGLKESGETNLKGITVKLYRNGTCVDTKTTDSNGHYTFGNVAKGNKAFGTGTRKYADDSGYNEYYVEFEYFGVKYKDTVYTGATGVTDTGTTGNWNNKSHASEANVNANNRKDFNDSLETIAYNKAYKGTTGAEASKTLEYTKSGHTSTLNWTEPTTIKAKSVNLYINAIGAEAKICTEKADHVEYLKHINLGLVERIQTDLSLKKDVVKAELNVNGYHATYNYGQLGTGSYTGTYKLQTPYVLNIYQADYKFRYDTYTDTTFKSLSDELDIKLTYKITITNESDIYSANIREIIDIYANSLTLEGNNKGLTVNTTSQYNNGTSYSYSGYTTRYLTGLNETLAPGASTTIELYYKVNKEADRSIILGEKANIAQIGAYSIYTSSGEKAGVVDQDSNPGIVNPSVISSITDDSKYEDHSYYTSIKLQIFKSGGNNYSRQIKGNVWEDLNTQTLSSGQKTGDGIKNSGETGAQNVTAVLLEVIEKGGKEYYIDTGITAKTNANGNYTLKNAEKLHAGEYVVRFVYGNNASDLKTTTGDTIRYSGQDYKSTVYTAPGNVTNENEVIEATAFKETKTAKGNKQVSIAKDNELRRLEVINYSTTMTYVKDNILKAQESDTTRKQTLAENTSMFADTKKFNIQVEKLGQTGVELPSNKVENIDGTKTYSYSVDEVNFGLLERPITKLELMDDITEVIATTASGEEILHAYFDISYKLNSTTGRVDRTVTLNEGKSIGTENVQVFNRTSSSKGFRYVNIDSELLQGMKVTIKYQFAIANIGDIDTSNENLIKIVKNRDITNVVNNLASSMPNTQVKYGTASVINTSLMKNYSYKNMETAVNNFKGTYGQYKTMVNGTANNKNYELGYFLGSSYYDNYEATTDKTVETRVDQIVSYIDNDLVFSPEENLSNGSPKFQTYTGADIEKNELLQGVGASNIQNVLVDSVGVSYVTDTKNNLVFNVEDETVNSGLYKFLGPLKGVTNINPVDMYVIELEASRVLASELDAIDVAIDNLAEIVKITNTSGRKAYIEFIDTSTGNVISPGPSGPTGYLGNSSEIIKNPDDYTVGKKEIDTNFTETVTFSPPTGLSQTQQTTRKVNTVVISILTGIVIIGTGIVTLQLIKKKKFYK